MWNADKLLKLTYVGAFYMSREKNTGAKQTILKIFDTRQKSRIWQICPFCFFFIFLAHVHYLEKKEKKIEVNKSKLLVWPLRVTC